MANVPKEPQLIIRNFRLLTTEEKEKVFETFFREWFGGDKIPSRLNPRENARRDFQHFSDKGTTTFCAFFRGNNIGFLLSEVRFGSLTPQWLFAKPSRDVVRAQGKTVGQLLYARGEKYAKRNGLKFRSPNAQFVSSAGARFLSRVAKSKKDRAVAKEVLEHRRNLRLPR